MKNYRTSNKPSLAQVGRFIYTAKKSSTRKPVKTWKTVLKEHNANRVIKTVARVKPVSAEMQRWLQSMQSSAE